MLNINYEIKLSYRSNCALVGYDHILWFHCPWYDNINRCIHGLLVHFEGNPLTDAWFFRQRANNVKHLYFLVVSFNKVLNIQLSCWWYEMPRNAYDVSVIDQRVNALMQSLKYCRASHIKCHYIGKWNDIFRIWPINYFNGMFLPREIWVIWCWRQVSRTLIRCRTLVSKYIPHHCMICNYLSMP